MKIRTSRGNGTSPQNAAIVVFSYYPRDLRLARQANRLVKAGMNVCVICRRSKGDVMIKTQLVLYLHAVIVMRGVDRLKAVCFGRAL